MYKIIFLNQYGANGKYHNFKRTGEFATELVKNGYQVDVICSNILHNSKSIIKKETEIIDGVTYRYVNGIRYKNNFKRMIGMIHFSYKSRAILRNLDYDVMICSIQSIFTAFNGVWSKKKYNTKFILEIRDLWPETLIQFGKTNKYSLFSIFFKSMEKYIYPKADVIVSTMSNIEDYIKNVLRLKRIPQIKHINNGVNYNQFMSLSSNNIQLLKGDKFKCLYTGSIGFANNLDIFVSTAKEMQRKEIECSFHFVGEGLNKDELIERCQQESILNVYFYPRIEYENIPSVILEADLLLLSILEIDLYKYGISMNKIFDYLASGKPILSNTKSTADDIIGKSGWDSLDSFTIDEITGCILKTMKTPKNILEKKSLISTEYLKTNFDYKVLTKKLMEVLEEE